MKYLPLGMKLTAWSTLVVGVALCICGFGAVAFVQKEQIEALDDQLTNEAHTFFAEVDRLEKRLADIRPAEIRSILPLTRTKRFVRLVGPDGRRHFESQLSKLSTLEKLPVGMHTLRVGQKGDVRLGVFAHGDLTLYLGAALNEINADEADMIVALLFGLPLLVATVGGGGWWLARKALGPVREITAAAERITSDRLSQRLAVPARLDEIGKLSLVLNAMFDRLESSFHQAMRFSADASHELKTPLTILRLSIEELLASPTVQGADQRNVAALLEQTQRLTSITDGLLLLSRADAGQLKLKLAPVDICTLVQNCADDAAILAGDRNISIVAQFPESLTATVDAGRLVQIVLNLLENAVKYNFDGGSIHVSAKRKSDGGILIRVANSGAPIPAEMHGRIFSRFFRVNGDEEAVGHGLGLSIARELARAHGGDLVLERSDATETVFEASLAATAL